MGRYESRPPRFGISQRVVLVRADGRTSSATIANISQTGFGLKVTDTPSVGERVSIRGEAGDVPAQIYWALENAAGGVFLQPKDD
jgi:hypothetical protein